MSLFLVASIEGTVTVIDDGGGGGGGLPEQYFFWGDSLTFGHKSSDPATKSYPARLGVLRGVSITNYGVNGYRSDQVLARADEQVAAYDFVNYSRAKVFIMIGVNDFGTQAAFPSVVQQNITDFIAAISDPLVDIYLLTIPASYFTTEQTSPLFDEQIQRRLNEQNQWTRDNAVIVGATGYIDVAKAAIFQDPNNTIYYDADKLHYVDAGYYAEAQIADNYLNDGTQPSGSILVNDGAPLTFGSAVGTPNASDEQYTLGSVLVADQYLDGDGIFTLDSFGGLTVAGVRFGLDSNNTADQPFDGSSNGNWLFTADVASSIYYANEEGGAQTTTGVSYAAKSRRGLRRTGSTITLEHTVNGTDWTVIHTYTGTFSGRLYFKAQGAFGAGNALLYPLLFI